jgi:hypothetical protein
MITLVVVNPTTIRSGPRQPLSDYDNSILRICENSEKFATSNDISNLNNTPSS